jgi:hypothetical protein
MIQELFDAEVLDERAAATILDTGADILNSNLKQKLRQAKNECRFCFTSLLALRGKLTDVVDYSCIPSQRITVKHIHGVINPADALTKPMNVKGITDWMYDTTNDDTRSDVNAMVAQPYHSFSSFASSMWSTLDRTLDRLDNFVSGVNKNEK